jgi:cytochrome c-type biogenesis protein CcsB
MLGYFLIEHPLFAATSAAYALAFVAYAAVWTSPRLAVGRIATVCMLAGALMNAMLVANRWIEAGHAPLKSMCETLVLAALMIAAAALAFERLHRTRVFGAVAAAASLGSLAYAVARWDADIVRLPPELQSGWFIPHVTLYLVGYGTTFLGAAASALLIASRRSRTVARALEVRAGSMLTAPLDLDRIALQGVAIGFALITLGLLTGGAWAHGAWGDYWAWDPKEAASLVSWLVFAVYLHVRRLTLWRGERAAWIAVAGFAIVAFTYLGKDGRCC